MKLHDDQGQEYEFEQWDKYLSDGVCGKLKLVKEYKSPEIEKLRNATDDFFDYLQSLESNPKKGKI